MQISFPLFVITKRTCSCGLWLVAFSTKNGALFFGFPLVLGELCGDFPRAGDEESQSRDPPGGSEGPVLCFFGKRRKTQRNNKDMVVSVSFVCFLCFFVWKNKIEKKQTRSFREVV